MKTNLETMNTTKPSDAAMRAAEKISAECLEFVTWSRHEQPTPAEKIAAIIDAELQTPDLEQRARAAAKELHHECSKVWWDTVASKQERPERYAPLYVEASEKREKIASIILRHFADVQGGSEKLREALAECHPARVWDLARQHYTGRGCGAQCPCSKEHSRRCNLVDEALAQSPNDDGRKALVEALRGITEHYCALVNSGDCGNWNPEEEAPVIAARATLKNAGERG